jgi:subtilisin family serine protease
MRSALPLTVWALVAVLLGGGRPLGATSLEDGRTMDGAAELESGKVALDQTDQKLDSRLRVVRGLRNTGSLRAGPRRAPGWQRNGRVRVLVRVGELDASTRAALEDAGLSIERENAEGALVEGWVAAGGVRAVAAVDGVRSVGPAERGETRLGTVSRGDVASRANLVRSTLGFTGAGVRVAVISDGVEGLTTSQSGGELPQVSVPAGFQGSGSEGTAMLEIVHDLAPNAELLFASGIDSPLRFVDAIRALTAAGAKVIVDDLGFFSEPYFQDGVVAQAVRDAVAGGVSYYTAAGNAALLHYQGTFRESPQSKYHDFNDGGAVDNTNRLSIPPGGSLQCVLQWDDPFGSAADDYDLLLLDENRAVVAASNNVQSGRGDPLEFVDAHNDGPSTEVASLVIQRDHGAARTLELFCLRDVRSMEHVTRESSIFGHAGIPEAVTVTAIDVDAPQLQSVEAFSSQGPAQIAFPPASRPKPDLAAFDGINTSVAGFAPFFGTSAAAPHVAAIAALMLEKNGLLTPANIQATLRDTAVDIEASGFDDVAGAGRVDALAAVEAVCVTDTDCTDADACTTDRCDHGRCAHAQCDDGNACNGVETCDPQGGGCVPGAEVPDGTPCPDATLCNGDETCVGGVCTSGPPLVCDDGDACTTNACAADTGCQFSPLEGVASICCVLDSGLPACPGVRLPRPVERRFAKARRLVDCGGTLRKPSKQRSVLRKAERALKRAKTAADRASASLPADCATSLAAQLGAARDRTHAVVQSLP